MRQSHYKITAGSVHFRNVPSAYTKISTHNEISTVFRYAPIQIEWVLTNL